MTRRRKGAAAMTAVNPKANPNKLHTKSSKFGRRSGLNFMLPGESPPVSRGLLV